MAFGRRDSVPSAKKSELQEVSDYKRDSFFQNSESTEKEFRAKVHQAMMERIDLVSAAAMHSHDLRRELEKFVADFATENNIQLNNREQLQLAHEMVDDMIGLGPLEPLLSDDSIADIMINNYKEVFVERRGKLYKVPVHFRDESHLVQIAQRIANRIGRRVDESSPMVDARLPDGSRVNIIMPPLALNGTSISIRKFTKHKISIDKMVEQNNCSAQMATLLRVAAKCRLNILIAGGTGSGKTTLLNALSSLIDPGERIVTIEDAAELQLQQPHVVRLESRPPNLEGEGEVTIRDLVRNALRMRPDRIIVGEVRGHETLDMLQAMNTGHDGSMSTIHANGTYEVINRLENMVAMTGLNLPSNVIRSQILGAINLIVYVERMRDGVRRITEISEVSHMNEGEIQLSSLFKYEFEEETQDHALKGRFVTTGIRPLFAPAARYFGLGDDLEDAIDSSTSH